MLRKIVSLIFLLIILSSELLATIPPYIGVAIRPVSINDKGEILCRTRILKNPSGGGYDLDIEYGLCVLTNDTILQFQINTVSITQGYDVYERQSSRWDSIFYNNFEPREVIDIDYHPVEKEYGFEKANIDLYKRDDIISIDKFKEIKKVDLRKIPQKSLYEAEGVCLESTLVHISYDFGNIIMLDNRNNCDGEELNIGARFNYPNISTFNYPDIRDDAGYECYNITGVLFIKKE